MGSEAVPVRLKDVCSKIGSGATPRGGKESYITDGISLIRSQNVLDFSFSYNGLAFINDEQADKLKNVTVQEQDVLINITGDSVARACLVPNGALPARVNQHVAIIRPNSRAESEFILYYLQSIKPHLLSIGSCGGTRNALTKEMLENLEFDLPSIEKQKMIAATLSCLDDKIELNNRIIANLEAQAQAIFKSWFVDFEPFQDGEFEESELGLIPKRWRVFTFSEILTPRAEKDNSPNIPEYSVTNTGIYPREEKYKKKLSMMNRSNKIIRKGDLVFGMSRTILNWGIMQDKIGGVSSAYHVFWVADYIPSKYLEGYMRSYISYFGDIIKPAAREGQGIDKAALYAKLIYVPSEQAIRDYYSIEDTITTSINSFKQQNATLAQLRDTLLPKLMSGEIEVPVEG
jgi:type I restriction enzyme S subunit